MSFLHISALTVLQFHCQGGSYVMLLVMYTCWGMRSYRCSMFISLLDLGTACGSRGENRCVENQRRRCCFVVRWSKPGCFSAWNVRGTPWISHAFQDCQCWAHQNRVERWRYSGQSFARWRFALECHFEVDWGNKFCIGRTVGSKNKA